MNKMCHIKIFIAIFLVAFYECESHTHQLHKKERAEDGSFVPRDSNHLKDGHDTSFDHEAILGSVKDAEEFDHLSPEESKRRLEILVGKMDNDNNKRISRQELTDWIGQSFKMITEEESEEQMDDVDTNDDGFVTWQEYVKDAFDIEDPNDLSLFEGEDNKEDLELLTKDRQFFDAADENNDGRLSKEEYVAFSHPEEVEKMWDLIHSHTLDEKDGDKDGTISFQEFVGDRANTEDKDWLISEKDKFNTDLDKDGDGILNKEEILAWRAVSNNDIVDDEVNHLFESADDDGDDVLSLEEILTHMDVFVGSDATDYGDHLENIHKFTDEL